MRLSIKYFKVILLVIAYQLASVSALTAQCTGNCGPNLVPNAEFELTTQECVDSVDNEMFIDYAQVQDWKGTACKTCAGNGSTPDYYNLNCGGSSDPNSCETNIGAAGLFTKVIVLGQNTNAREYIQTELTTTLDAGQEYCVSARVRSRNELSGVISPADGFGIWLTDQMVDIDTQNGGQQFIGPGSTINASPQVENPSGNFIDTCTTVTGTFCANGDEEWIVLGNFKDDNDTQFDPPCGTSIFSNCSGYVMIEHVSITPVCSAAEMIVSDDTLACNQSVDVELIDVQSGMSIEWISPASLAGNTTAGPFTDTPSSGTTYSAIVSGTNACGNVIEDTISQYVHVDCGPQVQLTLEDAAICVGECTDIEAQVSGGVPPYTITWDNGLPNGEGPHTVCPSDTTTYEVTVEDDAGDITTEAITLIVNSLPTIDAGNDVTICNGLSHDLLATGGDTYIWDNGIGSGAGPHTVSPNTNTTYTVVGTDVNGCEASDEIIIFIENDGPDLTVSNTDVNCFGGNDGSASVNATGSNPFSYNWTPTGGTNNTANNLESGSYTVEVTDDHGCTSSETVTINQPTEIELTITKENSDCDVDNGEAEVTATGGAGSYTYEWSPNNETTNSISNLSPGEYHINVTDQNGCEAIDTVIIELANSPSISTTDIQNVSCNGNSDGSIEVNVTGGTPSFQYEWSPNAGNSNTISDLEAGSYNLTVTDDAGCEVSETFTIVEPDSIQINGTVIDSDCNFSDGSVNLSVEGGLEPYEYEWNTGDTSQNISNLDPGNYNVSITDDNGCEESLTFTVETTGVLNVDANANPDLILQGNNSQLEVVPTDSSENYIWTPENSLSCTNCDNPTTSPENTTTYYVTVTKDNGCQGSDSVTVFVEVPCEGAYLPTIFSPNGDGQNDEFCVLSECLVAMKLEIFNRWGEKVFESTEIGKCWNGDHRGKKVNTGVYTYKLVATTTDGQEILESGSVTLVR